MFLLGFFILYMSLARASCSCLFTYWFRLRSRAGRSR